MTAERTFVVAGSGPSLRTTDVARIPLEAAVIRVNNFFLEPQYHLGRRVDCVYFSADPRAVRFYLATLKKLIERDEYDIQASASHLPEAAHHRPPAPFTSTATWPAPIERLLGEIEADEGVSPTSGAMAMLYAYGQGARRILLSGIDLYDGAKYAYEPPPRLARILSANISSRGYDRRLHSLAADLRVIEWLRGSGVRLERTSSAQVSGLALPLAPLLATADHLPAAEPKPTPYTDDWVARDGPRTVRALVLARALRRWSRPHPNPLPLPREEHP